MKPPPNTRNSNNKKLQNNLAINSNTQCAFSKSIEYDFWRLFNDIFVTLIFFSFKTLINNSIQNEENELQNLGAGKMNQANLFKEGHLQWNGPIKFYSSMDSLQSDEQIVNWFIFTPQVIRYGYSQLLNAYTFAHKSPNWWLIYLCCTEWYDAISISI